MINGVGHGDYDVYPLSGWDDTDLGLDELLAKLELKDVFPDMFGP